MAFFLNVAWWGIIGYVNLWPIHAIFSEFWYRFSYLALAWYSTLRGIMKVISFEMTDFVVVIVVVNNYARHNTEEYNTM